MILADIHTHTSFSTDSDEPMENMIEAAISRGLRFLCFTEHMDKDYPSAPDFFLDTDSYLEKFLEMKDKYRDKITLLFGVEPASFRILRSGMKTTSGSIRLISSSDPNTIQRMWTPTIRSFSRGEAKKRPIPNTLKRPSLT